MALTSEEWAKIASKCDNDPSQLMTPQERYAFLIANVREEDIARIYDIRSTQGGRRKRKLLSEVLEWDNTETYERPPSGRALEDLVLECVDAGIELADYL